MYEQTHDTIKNGLPSAVSAVLLEGYTFINSMMLWLFQASKYFATPLLPLLYHNMNQLLPDHANFYI